MKKILFGLLILVLAVPAYLLASGTVIPSSLPMLLNVVMGRGVDTPEKSLLGQRLTLPEGFSMNLYAGNLPKARFLHSTSRGDLLLSRPHAGDILLLPYNPDSPDRAGETITLLEGLSSPAGLDMADGWLYVAESNAVGRVRFDEATGTLAGDYQHIISGLTHDGNHSQKILGLGPDKKLYLAQGSTCNVCIEKDARRSTITRFNLDGSGEERLATGLRNTMGFDWAPWDGALYGTDNGRDMLGDDYPPCELNKIEAGGFYGWPYFNGANRPDPDFSEAPAWAANPIAPVHEFRAHNAPLGIKFIDTTTAWPVPGDRVALVALHGSWNRSSPDGYKVVSLHWRDGVITREDFLTGFELNGSIIGRPVDVAQGPDGSIYVSDDYAGAIYRLSYNGGPGGQISLPNQGGAAFELLTPSWLTDDNRAGLQEQGRELVAKYDCMACHNPRSTSGSMALTGLGTRLQYEEIIDRLSNPASPMPLYPLDEEQKRAVAVYLVNRK
jgi:glucose/arabinose dehydrogenase